MTASRGIGKGNNSGGRAPGAGRPKGSRNRRTAELIDEAKREGLLMPVDFLLNVMRDPAAELRDRMTAAGMASPYCHARLTALQAYVDPRNLDDAMLLFHTSRLEAQAAMLPDREKSEVVADQLERLLDDIPQLPFKRQAEVLRRLTAASEAGLMRLNDPHRAGAVPPRQASQPDKPSEHPSEQPIKRPNGATASASQGPVQRENGSAARPHPVHRRAAKAAPGTSEGASSAPSERRLRYNPDTGELEPI